MDFQFPLYGSGRYSPGDLSQIRSNNIIKSPGFGLHVLYLSAMAAIAVLCVAVPGLLCARRGRRFCSPKGCAGAAVALNFALFALSCFCGAVLLGGVAPLYLGRSNAAACSEFDALLAGQPDSAQLGAMDAQYRYIYQQYAVIISGILEHSEPFPACVEELRGALGDLGAVKGQRPLYFSALQDQSSNALLVKVNAFAALFQPSFYDTLALLQQHGIDVFGQDLPLFGPRTPVDEVLRILTLPQGVMGHFMQSQFAAEYQDYQQALVRARSYIAALRKDIVRATDLFSKFKPHKELVQELPATALARGFLQDPKRMMIMASCFVWLLALCALTMFAYALVVFCKRDCLQVAKAAPFLAALFELAAIIIAIYHFSSRKLTDYHLAVGDFNSLASYLNRDFISVHLSGSNQLFHPSVLQLSIADENQFVADLKVNFQFNTTISFRPGKESHLSFTTFITAASGFSLDASGSVLSFLRFDGMAFDQFSDQVILPKLQALLREDRLFEIETNLQRLKQIYDNKVGYSIAGSTVSCSNMEILNRMQADIIGIDNASIALGQGLAAGLSDQLTLRFEQHNQYILLDSLLNSLNYPIDSVITLGQHFLILTGAAALGGYITNPLADGQIATEMQQLLDTLIFDLTVFANDTALLFTLTAEQLDELALNVETEEFKQRFQRQFGTNTEYYERVKKAFKFAVFDSLATPFSQRMARSLDALKYAARFQRADILAAKIANDSLYLGIDQFMNNVCQSARYNMFDVKRRLEGDSSVTRLWEAVLDYYKARIQLVTNVQMKNVKNILRAFIKARTIHEGGYGFAVVVLTIGAIIVCSSAWIVPANEDSEARAARTEMQEVVQIDTQDQNAVMHQREMLLAHVDQ